jgi:molybdate transport system substrate-binding protein
MGAEKRCEVLAAAAADLAPLQPFLSASFAKTGGCHVRFAFGSSGMLARQIRNGAPYDLYLSANEGFVRELKRSGHLLPDSVRVYAEGRLGLWSRSGAIRSLGALENGEVRHIALANPMHAPYGVAAKEALESQGLWGKLKARIVYGENVQQAFQYADSGNADAVLTAWSLVRDKGGILVPAEWHQPIRQAGGVLAASRNQHAALRFMEFLAGKEGRAILARFGF